MFQSLSLTLLHQVPTVLSAKQRQVAFSFVKIVLTEGLYSPTETTPLMGQGERRKTHGNLGMLALIVVVFILLPMFLIFLGPYLSSGVAIERHKWDLELTKRRLDEQQRVEEWERQFKERLHQERIRQDQWERDLKERRLDEQVRMEAWEHQLQTRKRQEKVRQDKWEQKQKDIRREEEARQERERLREEQWQRDEEQRQRLGLYWAEPEANARCTAYSTRDYRARLLNTVPYHYNWLKPCEEIPIVIHGRSIHTTRCEIKQDVSLFIPFITEPKLTIVGRARVRCMGIGVWTLMNLLAVRIGISSRTRYVSSLPI
jgi:hypothetical protein